MASLCEDLLKGPWTPRWNIPVDYDYTVSSHLAYAADPPDKLVFTGPYADIRRTRDYTFHVNVNPRRQRLQGRLIERLIRCARRSERPWVIFTAGAMGAGKTHALRVLAERGDFPLRAFAVIDPDVVKSWIPEAAGYAARDRASAATHLHRESILVAEMAQEAALLARANLVVEGSLRDHEWYRAVFEDLRKRHSNYRIGILHVTASASTVKQRAAQRAAVTGRETPAWLIEQSLQQVPLAVERLSKLADAAVTLDSTDPEPALVGGFVRGESGEVAVKSWASFRALFAFPPAAPLMGKRKR